MLIFNDENAEFLTSAGAYLTADEIDTDEDVKFENSYICVNDILTNGSIQCNHTLFTLGNIEADTVNVQENLYCLGVVKAKKIKVSGDLIIFGKVECPDITVGGMAVFDEAEIGNKLEVQKDLYVFRSSFIDGSLKVHGTIVCGEGISGNGKLKANFAVVSDYCDLDCKETNLLCISEEANKKDDDSTNKSNLLSKMNSELAAANISGENVHKFLADFSDSINKTVDEMLSNIEENLDYDQIGEWLEEMGRISPAVNFYSQCYNSILEFSNYARIETVEEFLNLLKIKRETPTPLYKVSIVTDVLVDFFNSQRKKINEFQVSKKNNPKHLINTLYLLEQNKNLLNKHEYHAIFNKIYPLFRLINLGK